MACLIFFSACKFSLFGVIGTDATLFFLTAYYSSLESVVFASFTHQ